MLVLLVLAWLVSKVHLFPYPSLLLLSLNGVGTWEESCKESCPQVKAELHIFLECVGFEDLARTRKNFLSLSYFSRLSHVRLKPWATATAGDFIVSPLKLPSLALCMEQKRVWWVLNWPLLQAMTDSPLALVFFFAMK